MKLKPNSNLAIFVVLLVVIGLVSAYVPLLFQPRSNPPVESENLAPQNLDANIAPQEPISSTTTIPEGFSGLEEESQSLDDFLNQ